MPDINLRFINESGDKNDSTVVIFQKNQDTSFGEIAVAWTVIQNCGHDGYHPFTYPMEMLVSGIDSWGNYTQQLPATNGQAFEMIYNNSGNVLQLAGGPASARDEVDLNNELAL